MRKAGLSFLEASSILAQLNQEYGHLVSGIANAFERRDRFDEAKLPFKLNQWEQLLNIKDGSRSRLLFIETGIRNAFKVSASYMQMKLIVLTFFLFVVPFSALVSWFYLFSARSELLMFFFLLYPPFLNLVSEWARMNDEELIH